MSRFWGKWLCVGLLLTPRLLQAETSASSEEPSAVKVESPTGEMPTFSERVKAQAKTVLPSGPPQDEPLEDVESIRVRFLKVDDKTSFVVPDEPSTRLERDAAEGMKPEILERFNQRRQMMLQFAAKALTYPRLAFGIGMLTKEKLSQLIPSGETLRHPILALQGKLPKKEETTSSSSPRTLKARGNSAVQQMLLSLNHLAWTHPEIIANSNELGFAFSVGANGMGMIGNKGFGAGLEVGLSLGFNWERGAMTFEIFHDTERAQFVVGAQVKVAASATALVQVRAGDHIEAETLSGKILHLPGPNVKETTRSLHTGMNVQAGLGTVAPFLPFPFNLYQESGFSRVPWLRATAALSGNNRFTVRGGLIDVGRSALGGVTNVARTLASYAGSACSWFSFLKPRAPAGKSGA